MIITPVKTKRISANTVTLTELLDSTIQEFEDNSILVITSKIVSLCEGNVLPLEGTSKEELIYQESQWHLPDTGSSWGIRFTITNHTLIPTAGIDESNGNDVYILWPKDAQRTANEIRQYLVDRFNVKNVGVIITDSTCSPLRRGTSGIAIAHSGFRANKNYQGKKDLFGRIFNVSQANIAGGLAAAAVVTMGEGAESTPLALIQDVPFVTFQSRNPSKQELRDINIAPEDDLFAPFLSRVKWEKGDKNERP